MYYFTTKQRASVYTVLYRTPTREVTMQTSEPLLLIVLDGWGHQAASNTNAISQAKTPVWDRLLANSPNSLIAASGLNVGLPDKQMGNSEVGHMTLGAGRVIYQDLTLINNAIADGSFYKNPVLLAALNTAKLAGSTVHVLGLLSPGGVHSHEQQIYALLKMARQQQAPKICMHAFLDGRDTPPQSALASIQNLEQVCAQQDVAIASIMGRFYAMDRDKRTERTNAAVDLLINGITAFTADSAAAGLNMAYARGETDEFVQPTKIKNLTIQENDLVIFMNFRSDRARQLSYALINKVKNLSHNFVTLTEYDPQLPAKVAFPKLPIINSLGEILQQHNLKQLRIAETEKYAHVTFFFNAGREQPFIGEERIMIPSPKVTTYDLEPAMSALAITDNLLNCIKNKTSQVIICNFANADMLGHTGQFTATVTAIETLDACLGKIIAALNQYGGQALITADHGNAETMWDEANQQPHTAHTANLVPIIYIGPNKVQFKPESGNTHFGLCDVAPTMLDLLNIAKPLEMTGSSLIAEN